MIDVSNDVKTRIAQVLSGVPNGQGLTLDPANADHRSLITDLLAASGKGPDRYPALHATLASPPTAAGGEVDASIVDLGRDRGGRATSRTWIASRGGAYLSGALTLVLDAGSGKLLAAGTATQVGGNLVQVATRTAKALPATGKMQAVTFYHSQQTPATAPTFALTSSTQVTLQDGLTVNVTEPVQTTSQGPYIVIGEGRMPGYTNPDADYTYPSPANVYPDRLVVPFTGNATLPYETAVTPENPIGMTTKLFVTSAQAWTTPYPGFDLSGPVTASGYDVTWSYPFDNQTIETTASIQYTQLANLIDPVTDFYYQFNVPVDNMFSPILTFTVCSQDVPGEPSENCTVIKDLQYWWHCVAEGTLVRLADGSEAPIETLDNQSVVHSGAGPEPAPVIATSRAPHHDYNGRDRALKLRTNGGHELVLSAGHAVVTPAGLVTARDLRAGDTVLTASGPDTLAACDTVAYEGLVYNLRVTETGGREFGAYLANGIAVGDHLAQAAQYRARRHSPQHVLPTLPATHHQDYLSALADATAG